MLTTGGSWLHPMLHENVSIPCGLRLGCRYIIRQLRIAIRYQDIASFSQSVFGKGSSLLIGTKLRDLAEDIKVAFFAFWLFSDSVCTRDIWPLYCNNH